MNKQDLISQVATLSGLPKTSAEKALNSTIKAITESLSKGGRIILVGFGTFCTAQRAAKEGRNPRTGKKIKIPAKQVPKFRAGKQLKDAVSK